MGIAMLSKLAAVTIGDIWWYVWRGLVCVARIGLGDVYWDRRRAAWHRPIMAALFLAVPVHVSGRHA